MTLSYSFTQSMTIGYKKDQPTIVGWILDATEKIYTHPQIKKRSRTSAVIATRVVTAMHIPNISINISSSRGFSARQIFLTILRACSYGIVKINARPKTTTKDAIMERNTLRIVPNSISYLTSNMLDFPPISI